MYNFKICLKMRWTAKRHPLTRQIVRWVCIWIYESPRDICCKVKSHRLLRDQTGSQSICTRCYRNGDDRHHRAVQRAEIKRDCRYDIYIGYTYTNYHRCVPEIPSSPNSKKTSSILPHLYFEQAWCTVRFCFWPWAANSPRVSFLASFGTLHPSWSTKPTVT